jgi:ferritin-like metal-binding protein YciE
MAELTSLHDALIEEIKDLYDAEQQLIKALPLMAKAATNGALQGALEVHLEETRGQVTRLEKVFELLDEPPKRKHCAGIAGIIEEASEILKEDDAPPAVLDACIIAGGQRAEHYEMAAYGTVVAWARTLELEQVAQLLERTLEEEKAADEKLSDLAEAGINESAMEADDEEDEIETTSVKKRRSTTQKS